MNSFAKNRTTTCKALLSVFLLLLLSFCSFAQPGNNTCGTAATLTPGLTCTNITGTVKGANATAGLPATIAPCGTINAGSADVWYSFTPGSPYPTISLSNIGTDLRATGAGNGGGVMVTVYSQTSACTGLVAVACNSIVNNANLTLTPGGAGLLPNTPYRIRVSTNNNSTTTTGGSNTTWGFSICITEPVNDLCANAISLTSAATCVNTAGMLTGSSYTTIPTIGCGTANRNDVWYTFVAESVNPTITLSSAPANPRLQVFSGNCGALVPVPTGGCGNATVTPSGLTIGDTYYVRVYSDPNATGTFNICITDPAPVNNLCAGAILLTSGLTCVNTAGTLAGSTYTAIPTIGCGTTNRNDVWYSFVAQTVNPTISLSSAPANARVQIFSGNCGALAPIAAGCGNGSVTPAALTIGNTYYVRVYTDPNTVGTFNICITDPQPANDLCANAIALSSASTCVNTAGTIAGSTYTTIPTIGCGTANRNDVWYSFIAETVNPTITLSSAPANVRLQLFSGTCGALVSQACGTTGIVASALTVGSTYYVRVYSDPNTPGSFNICITDPPPVNDLCANAVPLTVGITCVTTAGTLAGATYTTIPTLGCGTGTRNDVWYTFIAKTTNPIITLSGLTNPRLQLFSGSCAALVSSACGNGSISATGLTIGNTYRIRVYSNPNESGAFNICVTDPPPVNDECTGAVNLTASLNTCGSPVVGNVYAASASATAVAPCTGPVVYDVWYKFTAVNENATVTLSSLGSNFLNSHMQLFSGGDCSFLTSIACGTGSVTSSALTPGNVYFVRVYSTGGALPPTVANSNFTICVTYVPPPPPANDLCANAITLSVYSTCARIMGTLESATLSSPAIAFTTCGAGTAGVDVWYKFVATAANTTITLADFGANFGATRRFQVFTGTCGSLTQVFCTSGAGASLALSPALTVGLTYYIRVMSSTATAITSAGDFSICITTPLPATRFGNGYINITRQTAGGVVEPNDILEIRMTVNLTSGTIYKMRYLDSVPTHTAMETAPADRIRVLTNEGIAIQNYTLTGADDAATYKASPGLNESPIRMNLGFNNTITPPSPGIPANNTATESASATGQLTAGNIPNVFGSALFATGFRVKVTGVVGDTIILGTPRFIYKTSTGGPDIVFTGTPYKILISAPMNLCANSTGVNMSQEFGGTFGTGTTLNRPTDLAFPIPGLAFTNISATQSLGDGQYAIVKNMSPRSGINRNAERSPVATTALPDQNASAYRMHGGHWDIDGDHTGTNNAIGNVPTDDGINAGYMLMVNADYVAAETYRQTLTDLCPNTYYEFSAWFRNICPTCGNDYVTGANYTPTRQPGVKPNLTFTLDGLDKYNTGEIAYNYVNTVSGGWVKKGFVFVTGPTQSTATFSIRNNSQGGGGNDWAMDDITISTCLPNMEYTPTISPTVCEGSVFKLTDTIRSYFSNYTNYKWQRSTSGPGGPWTDVTTPTTAVTGPPVAGVYKYWTNYDIPSAQTTAAHDGDIYRLIVATTSGNLSDAACQVTDGVTQITIDVVSCSILKTELTSFSARLEADHGHLSWTTTKENEAVSFIIEKSADGINFTTIGRVSGYDNNGALNNYSFVDPAAINTKVFYRIAIVANSTGKKYSRTVELRKEASVRFSLNNVVNPFSNSIEFEVTSPTSGTIEAHVSDIFGKLIRKTILRVNSGVNSLRLADTGGFAAGTYILQIKSNDLILTRKILKNNNY